MPEFFTRLPSLSMILFPGSAMIVLIVSAAAISGYLKKELGIKTNYTRKLFHVIIFSFAGLFQFWYGVEAVNLLGILMGFFIGFTVLRGEGFLLFEGLAREEDSPDRGIYVIVPYVTTVIGGVLSNILFPGTAVIGYLVNGWGDAAGEPVGVRFGKRKYRVPSITGISSTRTVEGSLAVFVLSTIAAFLGVLFLHDPKPGVALRVALAAGVSGTLVEAVTPHGMDNMTIQLAASAAAYFVFNCGNGI